MLAFHFTDKGATLRTIVGTAGAGRSLPGRIATVLATLAAGTDPVAEGFRASCEVAATFGRRLGFGHDVNAALAFAFERWDGHGFPNRAAGDDIPRPMRVVQVAQDVEATIQRLRALKALGLRLAVDDFGTGYSSLSYLQRFPIDILKIDRSFVAAIDSGQDEYSLARAIVSLARSLHLQAVAAGVETRAQVDALSELRCDLAQGFYPAGSQKGEGGPSALGRNPPSPACLRFAGGNVMAGRVVLNEAVDPFGGPAAEPGQAVGRRPIRCGRR